MEHQGSAKVSQTPGEHQKGSKKAPGGGHGGDHGGKAFSPLWVAMGMAMGVATGDHQVMGVATGVTTGVAFFGCFVCVFKALSQIGWPWG